jgi:membrane protease YdiL (CAAX protease family)
VLRGTDAYVLLPGVTTADPHKLHRSILISEGVYNYSTLLGGPAGEEPGGRGYALPRLEGSGGPVRASLLLALLWAAWHSPLFIIPTWSSSPFWIYVLILVGLSVIMSYGAKPGSLRDSYIDCKCMQPLIQYPDSWRVCSQTVS